MSAVVEARGLVKTYGEITAVDHVDLTVEAGDVYGYLGPNGAGKTTSLRMLLGLIRPDIRAVTPVRPGSDGRRRRGRSTAWPASSRRRASTRTCSAARTSSSSRRSTAATPAGRSTRRSTPSISTSRAKDRVGGYSHGMRQRLGIAGALIRQPRLLLLDEPATGLDPAGMRDMRALIRSLAEGGITVLLSSHLMNEVEELCNRVAIIRSGRIVYEGGSTSCARAPPASYLLRDRRTTCAPR